MLQNLDDNKLKIGAKAPDFRLPAVDGNTYGLESFSDAKLLIIAFTCNHCPYVQAYEDRIIALQNEFQEQGLQFVAINSNETKGYPEDSFENMIIRSEEIGFNFPYLRDDDQQVAKLFGAQCTPEFFLFDSERTLRYHGKFDDNWKDPNGVTNHDLKNAVQTLLAGKEIEKPENMAIGCSIKWEMN
jgi:peroxiredoxin